MQVGGYTLDLYCDNPECPVRTMGRDATGQNVSMGRAYEQFCGETGSECRALARRRGWRLAPSGSDELDLCPKCRRK